jgi:hypothetical protein
VLIEPYFGVTASANLWSLMYGLFVVVCGLTGFYSIRNMPADSDVAPKQASDSEVEEKALEEVVTKKSLLDEVKGRKILFNNVSTNKNFVRKGTVTPKALYWFYNPDVMEWLNKQIKDQNAKEGNTRDKNAKSAFTRKVYTRYIKDFRQAKSATWRTLKAQAAKLNAEAKLNA